MCECVGVLLESARIYNFPGMRWGKWRFCSTTKMPKFLVFLGRSEYATSNQGVRGSNPFGRTF
jgi:hypothetical protein